MLKEVICSTGGLNVQGKTVQYNSWDLPLLSIDVLMLLWLRGGSLLHTTAGGCANELFTDIPIKQYFTSSLVHLNQYKNGRSTYQQF